MYACVAATQGGARCRNFVEEEGQLCVIHQKKADRKGSVSMAPPPDRILMRFNINPYWRRRVEAVGVKRKLTNWRGIEEKHVAHAERFRRNPYRFREVADSGVPVFGPKEGISHVSLLELREELAEKGFLIQDMHLQPHRDRKMDILVITLSCQKPGMTPFPSGTLSIFQEFLNSSYRFVYVWVNPPDEDGKVVHTINVSPREPEQTPLRQLHFNNGLWAVVELSA